MNLSKMLITKDVVLNGYYLKMKKKGQKDSDCYWHKQLSFKSKFHDFWKQPPCQVSMKDVNKIIYAVIIWIRINIVISVPHETPQPCLWQYRLWSFNLGYTKLERFLPKNQHTQRKLLSFEYWCSGELAKIGHNFSNNVI